MNVRYALSFEHREMAEAAAASLRRSGLHASLDDHLYVDAEATLADEITGVRHRLQRLADEFGGDFLGNGAFVRISRRDESR